MTSVRLVRPRPRNEAAPPPDIPWWESVVAYLLMVPAVLIWFFTVPVLIGYWGCGGAEDPICFSFALNESSTGSYTGIVATGLTLQTISFVSVVATQLFIKRLRVLALWPLAFLGLVCSLLTFAVMSGLIGTPWGRLTEESTADLSTVLGLLPV